MLLYSLIRKSTALGALNFFPDKVLDFRFNGLTPVFTFGIGVQNTSNQSFTIRSMAGNIFSNGYMVGNASSFTPQTIRANSQQVILLDVSLRLLGIVNDLIKAFQDKNFTQVIDMEATANIDNLQIPLNLQFKIGL